MKNIHTCSPHPRGTKSALRTRSSLLGLLGALAVVPPSYGDWDKTTLFLGDNFQPLVAAPKEPRFLGSFQRLAGDAPLNTFNAGLVGLGENFGLVRWRDRETSRIWDLSLSSGLFSLFQLRETATDLINSDFIIGLDATYRSGSRAYRTRFTHESSHLGDEFLLKNDVERVNYSFESLKFTASQFWGHWRGYAGSGYVVRAKPNSIDRASLHGGGEYRGAKRHWRGALFKAGLNTDLNEQQAWAPNVSGVVGFEFGRSQPGDRRLGIQLEYYSGYSPWGQFYDAKVQTFGTSVYLAF